ncbi:MAG: hypothetical protein ABW252_24650 [Polyangiales bacterium]
MARATIQLIQALRTTAARLERGADYRWSHFGQCNCGNLAQTISKLSPREVYEAAFCRAGDWGEQARDFCPSSGYPIDYLLEKLFDLGMEPSDVRHLERLSDDRVLKRLGTSFLQHNRRENVVPYMRAWADLLEDELVARTSFLAAAE